MPTLVTITPDHSYVDGCVDVVVQGHHLGTTATGTISQGGDSADLGLVAAAENPNRPEHAQDVGFLYNGSVPANPTTESGFWDLNLTLDGETLTLSEGWYFQNCPASFQVDAATIEYKAAVGTPMSFEGCGLTDDVSVVFTDETCTEQVATVALTSVCGSAQVSAAVPTLPVGSYYVELVHTDGTRYSFGSYAPTGDTGGPACSGALVDITGGAR